MNRELKITRTFSLDPIVVAWLTQEAAQKTIESKSAVSASEVANDILRGALEKENAADDVAHSKKMVKKHILKQAVK
jgi:hypothetical protein